MRAVLFTACAVVCLLAALPAGAQGDDRERAREAYSRGQALFDAGDFAGARDAFQESLDASPHTRTIFNIALCEEKLGNVVEAIEMYQRYVDWPGDLPNRDEVKQKIEQLRELLPPEPEAPPKPPAEADEPEPEPEPPTEEAGPDLIAPGWITLGVGAAGMITGGVLLGLAQSRANEINKTEGEPYDPDVHDPLQDEGRAFEKAGWIVGAVGVAAVAAGVTMLLVSDTGDEEPEQPEADVEVVTVPLEGGLAVSAGWSF